MFVPPRANSRIYRLAGWVAAYLCCATPATVHASPNKDGRTCVSAFKRAQESELAGQLRDARESWQVCATAGCGPAMRQSCVSKARQLDADIPSIVPLVNDERGAPRVDVEVRVDGELLASRLDGRALALDPGVHELSFRADGALSVTQRVMVAQGQRNHPIWVSLKSSEPEPRAASTPALLQSRDAPHGVTPATRPISKVILPYVLAGAGLAAIGGYAWLVHWGRQDNAKLARCSPACQPSSVEHIRTLYVAADISLGVAAAALVAATWLFVTSGRTSDRPPHSADYVMQVQPTRSGAIASIAGSF
jgi:hypothetical protein